MAIVLRCKCGKSLRVSDDYAGKKARCPECQSVLVIPKYDTDDNGDDVPRAALVTTPKRRPARDDDDDDRPRVTRRVTRNDDDDDEPVVRRRSRRDDDDEDDDDDRLDVRKKQGGSKVLLFVLLGAGFFLIVLAGRAFVPMLMGQGPFFVSAIFSSKSSSGSGSGSSSDGGGGGGNGGLNIAMKYIPDGCKSFEFTRIATIRTTPLWSEIEKEMTATERTKIVPAAEKLGISLEDIENQAKATGRDGAVTILTLKKSVSAADIVKKNGGNYRESSIGRYKLYESNIGGMSFVLPENDIYVEGPAKVLESMLKRDKQAELPDGLKKAMQLVDFSGHHAKASEGGDFGDRDVEATAEDMTISTEVITRRTKLCKSKEAAEAQKKTEEANFKLAEQMLKAMGVLMKVTFNTSGEKVIATITISKEDMKKMMKTGGSPFK
jgi:hypothetical protein